MNLSEFYTDIENELTRGSKYTPRIPARVRAAGFWIERNYTLDYMRKFKTFDIAVADSKRTISFPAANRVKRFEFIRIVKVSSLVNTDSQFTYLQGPVHPKDVTRIRSGEPEFFWLDAQEFVWLDAFVTEDTSFEMYYEELSDWNNFATTEEPWLINYAYEVILAKTMLLLLPTAWQAKKRKDEYREMLQEGLRTLIIASQELAHGGSDNRMLYVPNIGATAT